MTNLDRGPGQPFRHPAGRTCAVMLPLALVWLLLAALVPALRRGEHHG